ncbi:hypothetical protein [Gordonia soli]|uniref:Malonyl-CoA:ACP transacylase (MAT) domain-containing protein n=1 Tax=Gordonia soli NBRC 108243 TaxID=1223545 RepID=M0QGY7_9ACTN|nr:hypothetical protein [Gordonia soli]GAC67870.1 hypothetical protein GS4_11_01380 [Gordonia soli NBRC 108243]
MTGDLQVSLRHSTDGSSPSPSTTAARTRPIGILHGAAPSDWTRGAGTLRRVLSDTPSRVVILAIAPTDGTGPTAPHVGWTDELLDRLMRWGIDVATTAVEVLDESSGLGGVLDRVADIVTGDEADLVVARTFGAGAEGGSLVVFGSERAIVGDPPLWIDGSGSRDSLNGATDALRGAMDAAGVSDEPLLEHLRIATAPEAGGAARDPATDDRTAALVRAAVDAHIGVSAAAASCVLGGSSSSGVDALAELITDVFWARMPATPESIGRIAAEVGLSNSPLCITASDQPWLRASREGRRHAALLSVTSAGVDAVVLSGDGTAADSSPIDWIGCSGPAIIVLTGADGRDVETAAARVRSVLERGADLYRVASAMARVAHRGPVRAVVVATDVPSMIRELTAAESSVAEAVASGKAWATPAGSRCDPAMSSSGGRVAFVYPGTYASYPGAEAGLFELFPVLLAGTELFTERPAETFGMAKQFLRSDTVPTPEEIAQHEMEVRSDVGFMSSSAVHYAMLGTSMIRDILDVSPDGVLGYSLGELCMLLATDLWSLRDGTGLGVQRSAVFRTELYGPRTVVREAWGVADDVPDERVWTTLALAARSDDVRAAVTGHDRVFITHVNTDREVLIAGDPAQCSAVVADLGCGSFELPGGGPVLHVPLVEAVSDSIDMLTDNEFGARDEALEYLFAAAPQSVDLDSKSDVAGAIAALCANGVDFPDLCRRAYAEGYRYFIEIGPGSDCTRWIDTNLKGLPHVAVSLDRRGTPLSRSVSRALAALIAGGVDIPLARLFPSATSDDDLVRELEIDGATARDVTHDGSPGVDDDDVIIVERRSPSAVISGQSHSTRGSIAETTPARSGPVPTGPAGVSTAPSGTADTPVARPVTPETGSRDENGLTSSNHEATSNQVDTQPVPSERDVCSHVAAIAQDVARTHIAVLETQSALQGAALAALESGDLPAAVATQEQPAMSTDESVRDPAATDSTAVHETAVHETAVHETAVHETAAHGRTAITTASSDVSAPGPAARDTTTVTPTADGFIVTVDLPVTAADLDATTALASSTGLVRELATDLLAGDPRYRNAAPQVHALEITHRHIDSARSAEGIGSAQIEIAISGIDPGPSGGEFRFRTELRIGGEPVFGIGAGEGSWGTVRPRTALTPIAPRTRSSRVERRKGFKPLEYTRLRELGDTQVGQLVVGDSVAVFGDRWDQRDAGVTTGIRTAVSGRRIRAVPSIDPSGGEFRLGHLLADQMPLEHPIPEQSPEQTKPGTADAGVVDLVDAAAEALRIYAVYLGLHLVFFDGEFGAAPDVITRVASARPRVVADGPIRHRIEVTDITMIPRPTIVGDVHVYAGDELVTTIVDLAIEVRERPGSRYRPEFDTDGRPAPLGRRGRNGEVAALNEFHMSHLENGEVDIALGVAVAEYDGKTELHIPNGEFRFVDRVISVVGDREKLRSGTMISEYDVATESWYHDDNSFEGIPGSMIMEASLQAAALTGSALGTTLHVPRDQRLSIRNLDGTATVVADLDVRGAVLRQESTLLSTTMVAGQILQRFAYRMDADGVPFYEGESLFGYFTHEALSSDVGLDGGADVPYWIDTDGATSTRDSVVEVDFRDEHAWFDPDANNGLCIGTGHFRLIDSAQIVVDGGRSGKGYVKATRVIDPADWYFDCHFHNDPVMPGSLGVEAVTQGLQSYIIASGVADSLGPVRFGLPVDVPFSWKYRGQILRTDAELGFEIDVTDVRTTDRGLVVTADASLFKPGVRIYHFTDLAVEVIRTEEVR